LPAADERLQAVQDPFGQWHQQRVMRDLDVVLYFFP